MSTKHLFTSSENLVNRSIKGIIATHTGLSLIPATRVVYDPNHDPRNVSVVSGGGSGHEPAYAGYVGKGMLTAAAYGDIFASPSAKQIISAIEAVPSQKGTLLVVTNYTGDQLHFGLAAERSNASGRQRIGIVTAGDDVAVGRKAGGMVGRRGLAGFILRTLPFQNKNPPRS
jgi:dihydroxyacetone kinase